MVFDRNGYLYHGRIQAVADAARKAGLDMDALLANLKKNGPPPEAVRIGAHVVASTTAIRFFDNGREITGVVETVKIGEERPIPESVTVKVAGT